MHLQDDYGIHIYLHINTYISCRYYGMTMHQVLSRIGYLPSLKYFFERLANFLDVKLILSSSVEYIVDQVLTDLM